jgi:serine/threonine protein phosphatase 1
MTSAAVDRSDAPRIYAIGDIHGRLDLLERMISEIRRDIENAPIDGAVTVTLGDYVDRGPESRGVIDRLVRNPFPTPYIALKGNHEELFQAFLDDPSTGSQWRHLGGLETLHSYGIPVSPLMLGKGYDQASSLFRTAVPHAHLEFVSSLKTFAAFRSVFLCHAGVRPGVPLERQSAEDLLWIRGEFLNSKLSFGKRVVHGHTPSEWPEVLPNRINIDTGAYATGRLTCVVLEGEQHRFLFAT